MVYRKYSAMKRIIDRVTYDTDSAKRIASADHGEEVSQASWHLYQTKSGAYFETEFDHDGAPLDICPVTKDQAKKFVELNANDLVEEYFGTMEEPHPLVFSRRTVIAAIDVLNHFSHGDFSEFLINLSNELYRKIPGESISLKKRLIELKLFLDDKPHYAIDGEPLQRLIVEKAAALASGSSPWPSPLPENHTTEIFKRALSQDGFVIADGLLVRALPENVRLHEAEDEVMTLLVRHDFITAREHLRQAYIGHMDGNWASANSQLRSFLESLFDELAVRIDLSAKNDPGGHGRRAKLAAKGFLSRDLNEWTDDNKGYVNGLMNRLHPHGSHPGLSDEEDSTFRLHTVLIAARLFLRRFNNWGSS